MVSIANVEEGWVDLYEKYATEIMEYLGCDPENLPVLIFPDDVDEVWDIEDEDVFPIFEEGTKKHDCAETETFSIGYLNFGYWIYQGVRIKSVSEQNASPVMFYITRMITRFDMRVKTFSHNDFPYDPGNRVEPCPDLDTMEGSDNEENLFLMDTDMQFHVVCHHCHTWHLTHDLKSTEPGTNDFEEDTVTFKCPECGKKVKDAIVTRCR
jgi:rubredoxin